MYKLQELLLRLLPLWDALKLSRQMLGEGMPDAVVAREWEAKLESAVAQGETLLEDMRKAGLDSRPEDLLAKIKAVRGG